MSRLTILTVVEVEEAVTALADCDLLGPLREDVLTVLANLSWLMQNRDAILDYENNMILVRDGGCSIECFFQRGFTPATRDDYYYFGEAVA
jgi:hypothetical protein